MQLPALSLDCIVFSFSGAVGSEPQTGRFCLALGNRCPNMMHLAPSRICFRCLGSLPVSTAGHPSASWSALLLRDWRHRAPSVISSTPACVLSTLPAADAIRTSADFFPSSTSLLSPYELVKDELTGIYGEIRQDLSCDLPELVQMAQYYFTSQGKAFRPMVVLLMAGLCAKHQGGLPDATVKKQRRVAVIAEMIHTASLIHDDVLDEAETRRNRPSLHKVWGAKKAVLTGDYILSVASRELARLRNPDVIICLAQVIEDLVKGELMQTDSANASVSPIAAYLTKTYYKTATLFANSCKAVAMLAGCSTDTTERAFQFGRNLGMAFQLVDDNLDFISTSDEMGKPTSVDLKLGLATAPVLLAAEKVPELNALIERRFRCSGDVALAREAVFKHNGVEQSQLLASQYSQEAVSWLSNFKVCAEAEALTKVAEMVLERTK